MGQDVARPDVQTRILDAAEILVRDKGVTGLTLDATAQLARLSKGGLLYHFATKEALLDGLLKRMAELIGADFETSVAAQPDGHGRVARAILAWGLEGPEQQANDRSDRAAAVFLAAFHHDPGLLGPIRALFAKIQRAVECDGLPAGRGMAIMAAMDGLFLARLFRLYTLAEGERQAVRNALMTLLESAEA
jgi:AcrR family transcriptional regulator